MRSLTLLTLTLTAAALGAQPSVVLVDDFASAFDWESVWLADLAAMGITPTVVTQAALTAGDLEGADAVLWNCGSDTSDTLTASDRALLDGYLDGGGNLLVVAPSGPADLRSQGASDWMRDRLGCDYVMPNSTITWSSIWRGHPVEGIAGTSFEGITFDLTFGPGADVPADDLNVIHTVDERAEHVLAFSDMAGHLGVARETPTDRTILLTTPLGSIEEDGDRRALLGACVDWLTATRFEGRGIWVVRNQLADPANLPVIVNSCADAGFNALFVQVRGSGDAYYDSATEPRASALSGQPPTYDPLAEIITLAHARSLEVHAWLNTGYVWGTGSLPTDPDHILVRHPEYAMVNRAGKSMIDYTPSEFTDYYSEGRYLSLAAPAVQDYLTDVFMEVVNNYDVDGVHFDFIRYCARGVAEDYDLDYNPLTTAAFADETGLDPLAMAIDSELYEQWQVWQRDRIGELVGRIREAAHAARPGIRVSAAVLSRYHLARVQATQDWIEWLQRGQLDTACIMSYGSDNDLVVQEALLAHESRGPGTVWVGMGANHDIELIIDRI
ncbi:family 10 glycosylhydrolase, partial [Candidatus Sumerlaeota bacterium]|nr:family 10 glycosylhydrolase [Candidatus Sumerlaeota bacterium]